MGRSSDDRIGTVESVVRAAEELRRGGGKVVFTNGCFDLLHIGHVQCLERARALGDALIVAVNSDASVRRLKGPTRPLVPEADRARLVASLRCVDHVLLFEDDTPRALIERILPDVLVKGGDYRGERVVGQDVVEAHGGRVVIIDLVAGRSTTDLVARIRGEPCLAEAAPR
ncbi:MAG: D-glycero-beta-D-manno-heptose 1-phosphate adenylyltransferase [Myxococcales bacterium]|nr:D-glycero-beta-D-manno-heptose 1-phosphate adenylyltransferase [Myxococcales bacterium]